MRKDFDGAEWAAKHNPSFKQLIAEARRTRHSPSTKTQETQDREMNQTNVNGLGSFNAGQTDQGDVPGVERVADRMTMLDKSDAVEDFVQGRMHDKAASASTNLTHNIDEGGSRDFLEKSETL
jgi:hypothetical protein